MNLNVAGIGEILWDLLPDGPRMGGAPLNFVYHAKAAGCNASFVGAVGDDQAGHDLCQRITELGLSDKYIQKRPGHPTGTVGVKLTDGIPEYTIHEGVAWDFIDWNEEMKALAETLQAVCFGSLAQRNAFSEKSIRNFIMALPPSSLKVFDINLRQHYHTERVIRNSIHLANILKINNEEIGFLSKMYALQGSSTLQAAALLKLGNLDMIALTMGEEGSMLITPYESSFLKATKVDVTDTVGAGDAFTAVMIAETIKGTPLRTLHRMASEVAAWVCTQQGATPGYENRM